MQGLLYHDIDTYNALVLQRLHAKTDLLLRMTRENYVAVSQGARAGAAPADAAAADAGAAPWSGPTQAPRDRRDVAVNGPPPDAHGGGGEGRGAAL